MLVTYADEGEGHTGYVYKCSGWKRAEEPSERPFYTCDGERVSSYRDGRDDLEGLEKGGMTTIWRWEVGAIKHWSLIEGDFSDAEDEEATWFVDPPYANLAGSRYRCKFTRHHELGAWAMERRGQVIACENVGATWLPFQPWRIVKANESRTGGKKSEEAIWLGGPQPPTQGSLFT